MTRSIEINSFILASKTVISMIYSEDGFPQIPVAQEAGGVKFSGWHRKMQESEA